MTLLLKDVTTLSFFEVPLNKVLIEEAVLSEVTPPRLVIFRFSLFFQFIYSRHVLSPKKVMTVECHMTQPIGIGDAMVFRRNNVMTVKGDGLLLTYILRHYLREGSLQAAFVRLILSHILVNFLGRLLIIAAQCRNLFVYIILRCLQSILIYFSCGINLQKKGFL